MQEEEEIQVGASGQDAEGESLGGSLEEQHQHWKSRLASR